MSAQPCGCDPTHKPQPYICERHLQERREVLKRDVDEGRVPEAPPRDDA